MVDSSPCVLWRFNLLLSPVLPIALAFAAGIAFRPYSYLTLQETFIALLALTALSCLLGYLGKQWHALISCWLGFAMAGLIFSTFEQLPPPVTHIKSQVRLGRIETAKPLVLAGWIKSPSEARPGSYIFQLALEQVRQGARIIPVTGTVRVYYYPKKQTEPALRLDYGTRVEIAAGNLRAPRNYGNPEMFDYAASMRRRGISYTALLRDRQKDLVIQPGFAGSQVQAGILRVRRNMLASIERLLPEKRTEQGILKAMLLGDDNWLSERTEEAFQRSGTYHVLVISGWNVAVFAGPLLLFLSRFRLANWLSSLVVFLTVTGFALIAQWEIPIVRASAMFLVYLVSRLFYRHRSLANSLALTAFVLLALHPSDLYDWGFQLSFLAVLTLATIALPAVDWKIAPLRSSLRELYDPTQDRRFRPPQIQLRADLRTLYRAISEETSRTEENAAAIRGTLRGATWVGLALAEALLFTTLMQVGYALVSAHYFHRLTWSGILGNLLILPVASCIVLLGMLVIPLELSLPFLGKLFGPILGLLSLVLESIARFAADLEALNFRVPTPTAGVSIVLVLMCIALATLIARRSRWAPIPGFGLLLACALLSAIPHRQACQTGKLELTAIDVGQGDALFVCFPGGSTMLMDAGGTIPIPGSPVRRQDIGETIVSPYLWSRGISKIDYVVLSHDHFDHMGGLEAIFANFQVGEFWMGPDAASRKMEWLRRRALQAGAKIVWPLRSGEEQSSRRIDGVEVAVLSPPPNWEPAKVSNNDSIVLRLTYGKRNFLLAGDIESPMERVLAESDALIKSDVLKVPHHGSRTSSTSDFIDKVSPAISLVSVGAYGRFGHPSAEVLKRLAAGNRLLYTTPGSGAITVTTDGNRMAVETFYDQPANRPDQ